MGKKGGGSDAGESKQREMRESPQKKGEVPKRRVLEQCNLQNSNIGSDPHAIADGDGFSNAAPLRLPSLWVNGMADAHQCTVRSNVAVLTNGNVGDRRVHDEAATVDEGRASHAKTQSIVDEKGRLDKGSESFKSWVAESHVMSDSSILFPVPSRSDDTSEGVSSPY